MSDSIGQLASDPVKYYSKVTPHNNFLGFLKISLRCLTTPAAVIAPFSSKWSYLSFLSGATRALEMTKLVIKMSEDV